MRQIQRRLYATAEEKEDFLTKPGNIITFKEPIYPWGTTGESRTQIASRGLKKKSSGHVKIIGEFYDSPWYGSVKELLNAVNWDWMRRVHQEMPERFFHRKGKGL